MNKSRQRTVVISNVDGTHMGLAVNWWSGCVNDDQATIDSICNAFPPPDVLRSAVEIVIAQATWMTRAGCGCGFDPACPCLDDVHHLLRDFSVDAVVDPKHRALCADLADSLERDPSATSVRVTPIPVSSVMDLVVFLGSVIEYRYGVPATVQINSYRRQSLEGAKS